MTTSASSRSGQIGRIGDHGVPTALLGPGALVVDLGANRGEFALTASNEFGATVLAVEPLPHLLDRSVRQSPLIRVVEAAVTGEEGEVSLNLTEGLDASVLDSPCDRDLLQPEGSTRVRSVTLVSLIREFELAEIDILKVDIEGAEIGLFDSLSDADLLAVKAITIEFHDWLYLELCEPVARIRARLRSLGFQEIRFALTNGDNLYLRKDVALSRSALWLTLATKKYFPGLRRLLGRRLSGESR